MGKDLVTITGVTGYLGSHCALVFLKDGNYRVRGTVRSKDPSRVGFLKEGLGDELYDGLELVEADLLDKESIAAAIEGSAYVVHTASPFILNVKDEENDLIKPAVEGTKAVLEACGAAGTVKRIVLTSSIAAVYQVDPKNRPKDGLPYDDSNWSEPDRPGGVIPYVKSKTLAERAAWDFIGKLPEDQKIELAVINPGLIFGPYFQTKHFQSSEIMRDLLQGTQDPLPRYRDGYSDVRDCALAHLQAVKVDAAAGKRFITTQGSYWFKEIADMLRNKFGGDAGWPVREKEEDKPDAELINFDHTPAEEVLGIKFRPMEESVEDMAHCMIKAGMATK